MIDLQLIHWSASYNAVYLLLLFPIAFLLGYKWYRSWCIIELLKQGPAPYQFLKNASLLRISLRVLLWFIAFLFLLIALMRPQWNKKEEIVKQEGRDVFIALDISRSMLAQDIKPNRLEFAKSKIKTLVHALKSERIGLILFSGAAFVQCPLTSDYSAFFMFLDQIDTETISSGSTALEKAIDQALQAFGDAQDIKNKLLIMVTDGEDFSSDLALRKKEAQKAGLIIFTLGVGTQEGAPIPVINEMGKQVGHQKDKHGAIVISRLNEGILKTMAADVGGIYIPTVTTNDDINALLKRLEKIEKATLEDKKYSAYHDQYPIFVVISFSALLLEWLL